MCGLGLGGFYFGRIVDRSSRPFFIYALLEICISVIALLTPFLVILVRKIYFSTGGVAAIGPIIATTLLLLLTVLVLGIPTFMMGGTLPALASATESSLDRGRRTIGLLYGVNTLGGFLGVCIATFYLLESFGNRQTLWLAATVNLLAGLAALFLYFKFKRPVFDLNVVGTENPEAFSRGNRQDEESKCRPLFVYFAAFIVGFCFFLMELVWYRILAPILGGTTYTFGLILASALAGIGIGGWLYRQGATGRRATLWTFVFTCVLEAFFIALPFALGDRLAIFTAILGSVSAFSFVGRVMGWSLICAVVVFPAAVVAGFQFPLLIGLLGQGRDNVGKHTGLVYICNTAGAILGSLAGGFGFIPLFSVLGCWRGVVFLLLGLGLFALLQNVPKRTMEIVKACMVAILICLTGMMILAQGPTAAWRHSFIGGGRPALIMKDENQIRDWLHDYRRRLVWEKDGVESGIAINAYDGLSLIVNGKSDGNARDDAGTQVMAPMVNMAAPSSAPSTTTRVVWR